MVQGSSKGLHKKGQSARQAHSKPNPKKGRRDVPPKKKAAVQHAAIHKSLSTKINRSIEQQMVASASSGKLTIMRDANIHKPSAK